LAEAGKTLPQRNLFLFLLLLMLQTLLTGGEQLLLLLVGDVADAACLTIGGAVHYGVVERWEEVVNKLHDVKL
jgi:hypothetical protein